MRLRSEHLRLPLAFHAVLRPGNRLESFRVDRLFALLTKSEVIDLDPAQSVVDLLHDTGLILKETQGKLLGDAFGAHVRFVSGGTIALSSLGAICISDAVDIAGQQIPTLEEDVSVLLELLLGELFRHGLDPFFQGCEIESTMLRTGRGTPLSWQFRPIAPQFLSRAASLAEFTRPTVDLLVVEAPVTVAGELNSFGTTPRPKSGEARSQHRFEPAGQTFEDAQRPLSHEKA